MKKQKPAFSIAHYLKKYKLPITMVVISTILITALAVLTPIYSANAIEILTLPQYFETGVQIAQKHGFFQENASFY